jgi:RND family efflux transporter MFP subunit
MSNLQYVIPSVLLVALSACSPPKPASTPQVTRVTVSLPRSAVVTNWDAYPGHLDAVETVELRPRVTGYLEAIHFSDGAEVKAGDLLFTIDAKPYQAELDRAQAQRQQAQTRLELAQNDLRRAEGLKGTKAISEEEYDSRNKAVREAEAALAAAKAAEASAAVNVDYTKISAPISGRIGRRLVTPGNLLQAQGSATLLATIVSSSPIYCYFDVEEGTFRKYRAYAQTGEYARSGLPCELALVNETGFPRRGHLDFFDNEVNPQTGTIRLRAVFDNADHALMPGMFANIRVLAGAPEQALLVPDVAVGSDQGYKQVYVVNQTNTVEVRSIDAGRAYGSMRAILKGLKPDERVVVNGLFGLRRGQTVEPQTAAN